jgi:hypothetical protein
MLKLLEAYVKPIAGDKRWNEIWAELSEEEDHLKILKHVARSLGRKPKDFMFVFGKWIPMLGDPQPFRELLTKYPLFIDAITSEEFPKLVLEYVPHNPGDELISEDTPNGALLTFFSHVRSFPMIEGIISGTAELKGIKIVTNHRLTSSNTVEIRVIVG